MRFGVLGRLEVFRADCTPVAIAGPARRQVLAALLARAGSFVSADQLVDDLWGVAPPRSALGNLRSHVARLRDDLGRGEDVLVTEGNGYRLLIERDDLDATRFETLLGEAGRQSEATVAIALYDEALRLWRNEAYLEFGDAPFAVQERVRLAELRTRAQEQHTDLLLGIGGGGDLVAELEQRVLQQPYRERGWEQLALALYRDGRQADALDACRRARSVLNEELGIDPGPGLQDLESRILRQDASLLVTAPPPPAVAETFRGRCPYLGLTGYDEQDAAIFVGRERLTSVLAAQIADHSVVVVTGPSGVGKSSLIRAGLLPALRGGAVPGSAAWRIHVQTPANAVSLHEEGRRPDLVVLDQAEALFTAGSAATGVAEEVSNYVKYGNGRLVVVLRGDYFGRLTEIPQLASIADGATVVVGPMRADELRRAVVEPAAAADLQLEPDLIETIMEDVAGQPEPLPLLSEAMVRTWRARTSDLLTLEGYRRSGGVAGALEAAAEECYLGMDEDARTAARHVLVRMAAPSGTGGWVRRALSIDDHDASGPEHVVLEALVHARLAVVTDRRVELAHDALLQHWPRLRDWLDERAVAADLLDHLGRAATAWRRAGRPPGDLYRGPRLAAALDWYAAHPLDLSSDENEFLDASEVAAHAELDAARERATREAAASRRLRRIALALLAVVVLALAGGAVALSERATAQRREHQATAAALTADANRVATLANTLPPDQRGLGLLLAAQGVELQQSDVSAGGLQTALIQVPPALGRLIGFPAATTLPHLDTGGKLLVAPGTDGTVRIYDVVTGRLTRSLAWSSARQFAVFSADDRFVAAGGSDGSVVVWDVGTGRVSGTPLPVGDGVVHPVFDPQDDNRVYVASTHGGVTEWDRSDPTHPRVVARFIGLSTSGDVGNAPNLTVSTDGKFVAAGDTPDGSTVIWDAGSGREVRTFGGASLGEFAAAGDVLPIGFGNDTLLVDGRSGSVRARIAGSGGGSFAVLSADGRRLAVPQTGSARDVVTVYDVTGTAGHATATVPNPLAIPLGFLLDGRLVTSESNESAIWQLDRDLPPLAVRLDTFADRSRQGSEDQEPAFLAGQHDVLVDGLMYDGTTGHPKGSLLGGGPSGAVSASPDGRLLAGGVDGRGLGLWDMASGRPVALLPGTSPSAADTAVSIHWSPDGRRLVADVGGSAPSVWDVSDARHPSSPRRVGVGGTGVVDDAVFATGDRRLLVLSAGGTRLAAVELATGRVDWAQTIAEGRARQWAVSPDGTSLAVDSGTPEAGQVSVMDAATGRVRGVLRLPTYGGVGYLQGGRWLVVSSDQPAPQAQLYDAGTLQPFGVPFATGDTEVDPLATDPAGTRFSESIVDTGLIPAFPDPLVWSADPQDWIRTACGLAGRNLTRAEWHRYLPGRPYQVTCQGLPPGT